MSTIHVLKITVGTEDMGLTVYTNVLIITNDITVSLMVTRSYPG